MTDSRSSEERDQEDLDIMTAVSKVRVPMAPLFPGDLLPYLAQGTGESTPELALTSQTGQGTKFSGEKPLPGQGNILCRDFQWK